MGLKEKLQKDLIATLSTGEVEQIIAGIIAETGATSIQDLGKVMPKIMQKVKGRANGSKFRLLFDRNYLKLWTYVFFI
jgi:hypothetical protein